MEHRQLFKKIKAQLDKNAFDTKESWSSKRAWKEMVSGPENIIDVKKAVEIINERVLEFCRNFDKNSPGGAQFCLLRKITEKRNKPEDKESMPFFVEFEKKLQSFTPQFC